MKTLLTTLIASTFALPSIAETTRVYFGTGSSKGIYFSDFDTETGVLSEPKLAIEIASPGFIDIHPNRQTLYSTTTAGTTNKSGGVAALKINADGTLTEINRQPTFGKGTCFVSTDAAGLCLMAVNYGSGDVASFKIEADGSVSPPKSHYKHEGSGQHPQRQKQPHPHSIFPGGGNNFAYVPDLGIDKIKIYRLDIDQGMISTVGEAEVPGGSMGPRHLVFSFSGKYAYVINELDLSVSVFEQNPGDGSLKHLETRSALPEGADKSGMTGSEIRLHPAHGQLIYAALRDVDGKGRDSIAVFSSAESKDGFKKLAAVPAEVAVPRNFNIDPTGKWLLVGGQKSNDIAVFKLNPETGVPEFTGKKIPFPGEPICIDFMLTE